MNDKEINDKIDLVLKPFMIDDINKRLVEDGQPPPHMWLVIVSLLKLVSFSLFRNLRKKAVLATLLILPNKKIN